MRKELYGSKVFFTKVSVELSGLVEQNDELFATAASRAITQLVCDIRQDFPNIGRKGVADKYRILQ
jgi:hypothetical protein